MTGYDRPTAPLTRAQKFQWCLEKGLAEAVWPLPDTLPEAVVRRLVDRLERCFEILRTSIDVVDGELRQVVHAAGSPMQVVGVAEDADLARCRSGLAREFVEHSQGRAGEFLAQFYLVHEHDGQALALVADNAAVDAAFTTIIDAEIAATLAAPAPEELDARPVPRGLQPQQMSAWESGPDGRRERQEAADYLKHHFATTPPQMHATPAAPEPGQGRYYRCTLTLDAADTLLGRLISTTGLLPSALILAAFTGLMCWRSQTESCSANVSVANRHRREFRAVLGAMAQRAPVVLNGADVQLEQGAAAVQGSLARAHPVYGRYDPLDLVELRNHAQRERRRCLSTDLAYNFIPPPQGWGELMRSGRADALPDAGPPSTVVVDVTDEAHYEYGASLSVRWGGLGSARLSMHGDSCSLKPSECGAVLQGIEFALRQVASGRGCTVSEVADEVGLRPIRRSPRAMQVGAEWFDPDVIEARLRGLDQVEEATVKVEPSDCSRQPGLRAVVRLPQDRAVHFAGLREQLLAALDSGEILALPEVSDNRGNLLF